MAVLYIKEELRDMFIELYLIFHHIYISERFINKSFSLVNISFPGTIEREKKPHWDFVMYIRSMLLT